MKVLEQNRSLVFLLGTLVMGILIIGVLLFVESNDVKGIEIVNEQANTNFKALETKIEALKNQNFNPNNYSTLLTDINSSFDQELITGSAKSNLVTKLTTVYSDLVYKQSELFLTSDIGTSHDVLSWLNQLQSITSKNSRIDTYKNQIKWYNYYSITLPNKVKVFISDLTNYNDKKYSDLTNELKSMPNFNTNYKNRPKFYNIRNIYIKKLDEFNSTYYQ